MEVNRKEKRWRANMEKRDEGGEGRAGQTLNLSPERSTFSSNCRSSKIYLQKLGPRGQIYLTLLKATQRTSH